MPIDAPGDRLEYNGYRFDNALTETRVTAKFVYDKAGRTVTHTAVSVSVKSKIVEGAAQSATLEAVLAALSSPGGAFYCTGKGFDFVVNAPGSTRDLKWGPKPQVLSWKSLGGGQAAEVNWQCDLAVMGCADAPDAGRVMEFTTTVAFATDEGGYTTRTFAGSLTIPATRRAANDPRPPDSADNYFDRVVPPLLPNFKRTIQRQLSPDKTTLDVTVTDTEQAGHALPDGVVAATGSHEVYTAPGAGAVFKKWVGVISEEYEFVRGKPRRDAFDLFMALVADRAAGDRRETGFKYLPMSMRIAETNLHGRVGATLSLTYSLLPPSQAANKSIFPLGGLWRPVPDTNWNTWSASLGLARAPRGLAGLRHQPSQDVLVDLCLNTGSTALTGGGGPGGTPNAVADLASFGGPAAWEAVAYAVGVPVQIDPLGSWQSYECRVVIEPVDRIAVHKPLPTGPAPTYSTLASPAAVQAAFATPKNSFYPAPQYSPTTVVQDCGSTDFFVRLVGKAVRVGHEIPPPSILGVYGSAVHPANHPDAGTYFSTWTAGYTTHPIQAAEWNLRWFLQLPQGLAGISIQSQPRPDEPGNVLEGTVR